MNLNSLAMSCSSYGISSRAALSTTTTVYSTSSSNFRVQDVAFSSFLLSPHCLTDNAMVVELPGAMTGVSSLGKATRSGSDMPMSIRTSWSDAKSCSDGALKGTMVRMWWDHHTAWQLLNPQLLSVMMLLGQEWPMGINYILSQEMQALLVVDRTVLSILWFPNKKDISITQSMKWAGDPWAHHCVTHMWDSYHELRSYAWKEGNCTDTLQPTCSTVNVSRSVTVWGIAGSL